MSTPRQETRRRPFQFGADHAERSIPFGALLSGLQQASGRSPALAIGERAFSSAGFV